MRIIITGCMAPAYTLEMQSFAVHLSAQCETTLMVVLLTLDHITNDRHQVLCLLLLHHHHLVLLHP